ncbi:hypothetical protein BGZ54_008622, partial [Gamsiella multidivaricata]
MPRAHRHIMEEVPEPVEEAPGPVEEAPEPVEEAPKPVEENEVDTNNMMEDEEMVFTITHRPRTTLTESLEDEEEEEEEEVEEVADVGPSTGAKRKAPARTIKK